MTEQRSLPVGTDRIEAGNSEAALTVLRRILPPTGDAATSGFYRDYIEDQIKRDAITCEDLRILCAFFACSVNRVVGKIVSAKRGKPIEGSEPKE